MFSGCRSDIFVWVTGNVFGKKCQSVFQVVVYLTTIDMLQCKIDRLDVIFVAPWSSNAFVQFVSGALGSYNPVSATPMQDGVRA